jgi:metal-responsive CopG/Arc/MetJ family transcriptional regulator
MKIPNNIKKIKISISIDSKLDEVLEKITIEKEFYKKSRLINFILNKYIEDNNLK